MPVDCNRSIFLGFVGIVSIHVIRVGGRDKMCVRVYGARTKIVIGWLCQTSSLMLYPFVCRPAAACMHADLGRSQ